MIKHTTPDSPQAFPSLREPYGLSMRDYFAGQAITGILANVATQPAKGDQWFELRVSLALTAYDIADAMLKAREQ